MVCGCRKKKEERGRGKGNVVLIKGDGKSYSDILRQVKSVLDPTTAGDILAMRKSRGGDHMLLMVGREQGTAEKLKKAIGERI